MKKLTIINKIWFYNNYYLLKIIHFLKYFRCDLYVLIFANLDLEHLY